MRASNSLICVRMSVVDETETEVVVVLARVVWAREGDVREKRNVKERRRTKYFFIVWIDTCYCYVQCSTYNKARSISTASYIF